jgi:NAD(P)-dependent dehydrogenase (short-subunit alcohol dehydrogenase family)
MKRVVLITGAAGGIGNATARVFSAAGWHVVGVDKRKVRNLKGVHHFIQGDISDPDVPENIITEVKKKEGRLNALINNAALQICKPFMELTPADWDLTMASNLRSVFLAIQYAYPLLKKSKGAIVNMSSVHAVATSVGIAAYAASKGAILALTRSLALEFGKDGVRVNAILPGAVDTPMLHAGLSRGHVGTGLVDELVRGLGRKHVLGRVGKPEEIAHAILFLADSGLSSFMTGQTMIVDGGATARLSTE